MADNNDTGDKKLTVGGGKTLSLKRPIETGIVKQSFSHGRTNAVVVETVKRRPGPVEARPGKPVFTETKAQPVPPPPRPPVPEAPAPRAPETHHNLTNAEADRRAQVLAEARRREEEERRRQEQERREREERAAAEARRREQEAAAQKAAAAAPSPAPTGSCPARGGRVCAADAAPRAIAIGSPAS